jgi:hypothetical protein
MTFEQILILAVLAESLTDTVKFIVTPPDKSELRNRLIALGFGVLGAVGTKLDLFVVSGIPMWIPWLGVVLTGIILARGANVVHDLINLIQKPKAPTALVG